MEKEMTSQRGGSRKRKNERQRRTEVKATLEIVPLGDDIIEKMDARFRDAVNKAIRRPRDRFTAAVRKALHLPPLKELIYVFLKCTRCGSLFDKELTYDEETFMRSIIGLERDKILLKDYELFGGGPCCPHCGCIDWKDTEYIIKTFGF